jgi:nitroimidazol reductase NimA-like FMN-containing flavoprotein (pyridoxamine 5'-phosphate oxidase superfamily)
MAAERDKSISALLTRLLENFVRQEDDDYEKAMRHANPREASVDTGRTSCALNADRDSSTRTSHAYPKDEVARMASTAMTREEREAFLADVHVGIISINDPGRTPLTVPIWYSYEPGGLLTILTGRDSRKATLIRKEMELSLCVQTETGLYKYVSVEGPVVEIEDEVDPAERKAMAYRYLLPKVADSYLAGTAERDEEDIAVRMRPRRWLTVDYNKTYGQPR